MSTGDHFRFGFYQKTKPKPVFFVWLGFSGLGSVWFFRFQGYKTKTKPNRSVFKKF